ncbi:MAG: SIS domain-containing protein [Lachnoclostridium edouardi]|uniref:KpsF/GutQ family sugar-phosphate isomerase n=1 Tax=Lachnoclostridium edouardi TaxID=1926283 RepID=UPI0026DB5F17|nr:SIS domain-containing protein [Lachnoclostridium edouardi]MDO4279730.1 SIS domain-containing protein [Lachnoclostridium edouardi]
MNIADKMKDVWKTESEEVQRLCENIDFEKADNLAEFFLKTKELGGKIFFAGVGTSAAAAKKAAHSFSCIEFPSVFLSPGDAVHGSMGVVQKNDIVVLISKGGNTEEIIRLIESLKLKGAVVAGITENLDSTLAQKSDITVKIKIRKEPDPFNMLATASTLSVIAFFDALAIYLMEKSCYTREQFAVIHKGGAVGDRLLKGER